MYYPFEPVVHVDDYLAAIVDAEEFVLKRDFLSGIMVINYNFVSDESFPDPASLTGEARRHAILRRDCRGIEFDLATGDVVTKKYHKFFNVNQKPETQIGAIDWSQPHHILEKLDGTMITPYRHPDGHRQWHTKMGATEVAAPVTRFVAASAIRYGAFADAMREDGQTPIFEWCSRQQRIVVDYPQERLVLTAVRDNRTGNYASYADLQDHAARFGLPLVRALVDTITDIQQFLREAGDLDGAEGYVIRFHDGHAVKVKGAWYSRIHNTKDLITREKNVWALLLNNTLDDAMVFMQDSDRSAIEAFAEEFYKRLRLVAARLADEVAQNRQFDKKSFAQHVLTTAVPQERGLLFRIWDGHDAWTELVGYLVKHVGTQAKIDSIRSFVGGLSWRDFFGNVSEQEEQ